MNANELKDKITLENTIELLEYFGAEIGTDNEEYCTFTSICHHSDSKKIYLYKETNTLFCFVCGTTDVISLVQECEGLSFNEAMKWLVDFFHLDKPVGKVGRKYYVHEKKEIIKKEVDISERLPSYNESILNTFEYYPIEWLIEDISIETMKQFGISIDKNNKCIIIPHRDIDGNLVGIRCRNLDEDRIERFGKYIPYTCPLCSKMYTHKLSMNLYGLYQNLNKIKERKRVILFESEKSTLKFNSWYKEESIACSLGGSTISEYQLQLLKSIGVEDVIFLLDYEVDEKLLKKFDKIYKRTSLLFNVYIPSYKLMSELLEEKSSPIDYDKEIFEKILINKELYKNEYNN